MDIAIMVIELGGSLGLMLYGMKVLSDGIQRAAGDRLKHALNLMTGNTFKALLTGAGVTALIQSSSATTVMVVSFVNAGLLTVVQAAGVIFGANIGTTVTAWIVSLIGFKFSVAALALPMVGMGFAMTMASRGRSRLKEWGEAAVGFGILFLGLEFLSGAIPTPSADVMRFLADVSGMGIWSVLLTVAVGAVFTMLVHASSATAAIAIALAVQGVIGFEMAAGLVLGSNIGTTIDAFLASLGARANAKRAAWIHILFNVLGSVWAIVLFRPFIALVDFMAGDSTIAQHVAMLHTIFNLINAVLFAPFARQFADLVSRLVKAKPGEEGRTLRLEYAAAPLMDTPELNILRARKEIATLAGLAASMFSRFREILGNPPAELAEDVESFRNMEEYADQMREELSRFLLECAGRDIGPDSREDVGTMIRIVAELETVTDDCFSLVMLMRKAESRKSRLGSVDAEGLSPYTLLVEQFLTFVRDNIERKLDADQVDAARDLEDRVDDFRAALKRKSRKRMQAGSDVKAELLFMDVIRHIEKIGDHAYGVAQALGELN